MNATTELTTFINQWLESWTGNQPDDLLQCYADDAFYLDPARPDGLNGKDAMAVYFTKLLAKNPDWVWRAEEVTATEKGCMLKWKAQIPTPTGLKKVYGLDIVEISEGKITRNEVYFDRTALM